MRGRNPCNDCSVCCELLGIPEIHKPAGQICEHCPTGHGGCAIYDNRPRSCKDFRCGYHLAAVEVPIEFRPDNSHILLTGSDKKLRVHFVHVDPKYPGALDTRVGKLLVSIMRQSSFHDILVTIGDKTIPMFASPFRAAVVIAELQQRDKTMQRG